MAYEWLNLYPQDYLRQINISELTSLRDAFCGAAKKYTDLPALSSETVSLSYGQLARQSANFAKFLQCELGLKKGEIIGIVLPNIVQFAVAFLGAQIAGLACVCIDPADSARGMSTKFRDSGIKTVVIIDSELAKVAEFIKETAIMQVIITGATSGESAWRTSLPTAIGKIRSYPYKQRFSVVDFSLALRKGSFHKLSPVIIGPDDICLLQYAESTDETLMAAEFTQMNILAAMAQFAGATSRFLAEGSETIFVGSPLHRIFALVNTFLAFLCGGQHFILVSKISQIDAVLRLFARHRPNIMVGEERLFASLSGNDGFQLLAAGCVKLSVVNGGILPAPLAKSWQANTGSKLMLGYGPVETAALTHMTPLGSNPFPSGSIGIPLASTDARIVDNRGQEVDHGTVGELVIKGPQVMRGYHDRAKDTALRLRDGWLFTGAKARRDDKGWFFLVS